MLQSLIIYGQIGGGKKETGGETGISEMRTGRFTDAPLTGSLGGTHLVALQEKSYYRLLSVTAPVSALET